MRIFHEAVFDEILVWPNAGTATYYSQFEFNQRLGSVDQLAISGYSDQVSSASAPGLTARIEYGLNHDLWFDDGGAPAVSKSLNLVGETLFQGVEGDPDIIGKLPLARLKVQVSGTNSGSGRIRIWVTGRDFSRHASARGQRGAGQGATGQPVPRAPQTMMR